MDINYLVKYSESLYKIAYNKMNNTADAEELAQETLLQALIELRKNPDKIINNDKAWLNGIMNNCFYAMMRKKYRTTYVTYDVVIDNYLFDDNINDFIDDDETRIIHNNIQQAVSRLAKIHRDVIYKFYMQNKNVNQIAKELDIPRGTVLSRLDNGRKIIKQGVMNMSKNLMYIPQKLGFGMCGRIGDNNEPFSTITTSIHQNILILAYEKPITESEISEKIGIPCVYIEEIVNKLIDGELMKRTSSGKVYTDFIINFEKNIAKLNEDYLELVDKYFDSVWEKISILLEKFYKIDFVKSMDKKRINKLTVFLLLHLFLEIITKIRIDFQGKSFLSFNDYPERSNNGKWMAIGTQLTDYNNLKKYRKYHISGLLSSDFYYKNKSIKGMDYQTSFGDTHGKYSISGQFWKFIYDIITDDISSENEKYLKDTSLLCEMEILDNDKKLAIPKITFEQEKIILNFIKENYNDLYEILYQPVIEIFKKHSISLPPHLKEAIPLEFLTIDTDILRTGFLVTAKEKGLFLKDVDYPCPAIVFVTE